VNEEVEILRAADAALVRELSLVLNSVGIPHRVVGNQHQQWIVTREDRARDALEELASYHRENLGRTRRSEKLFTHAGAASQALFWAALLAMVHVLVQARALGLDWKAAGRVDGQGIFSGELWRPFTALTLHADLTHLMSNLFFGALFVALLSQVLGTALTWNVVLFAGAAGNLLNAAVVGSELRSIGASTAVFAALGGLTAVQFARKMDSARESAKRWIPLIAGVLLLGWNGMGGTRHDPFTGIIRPVDDNTDIGAHVAGFVCGLLLGLLAWRIECSGRFTTKTRDRLLYVPAIVLGASWVLALMLQ